MYIKNQSFSDEDTLLEMIFDFALGEATEHITTITNGITAEMLESKELQAHLVTLEEEDRLALEDEILQENLARALMNDFTSFKVQDAKLYGVADSKETLLYSVDLH
jgi:regulator of replication initiation timing